MKKNGIRSAPHHSATNGLAESLQEDNESLDERIKAMNFLLTYYRTTPHATTKEAPCGLTMERALEYHRLGIFHW